MMYGIKCPKRNKKKGFYTSWKTKSWSKHLLVTFT